MDSIIGAEWTVEWAAPLPNDDGCYDNLVLSKDQAQEYGDELVLSLRVDEEILQAKGLNPREPFAWKIEDGELVTKQISRQMFESVAEDDRHDSEYARQVLQNRARRRLGDSR
jgi:hypothetical protein